MILTTTEVLLINLLRQVSTLSQQVEQLQAQLKEQVPTEKPQHKAKANGAAVTV